MAGLNLGGTPITDMAKGSTPIVAVHVGAEKVWPSAPENPIQLISFAGDRNREGNLDWDLIAGLAKQAGDIGVVTICNGQGDSNYNLTGWTLLIDSRGETNPPYAVWTRVLDGTETTMLSTDGETLRANTGVIAIFRYAKVPTSWAEAQGNSVDPDPPSLSGFTIYDWVIACGGKGNRNEDAFVQANYTFVAEIGTNTTDLTRASTSMMSYRTGVAGSENPGAFSMVNSDIWRASTIRLEPI